MSRYNAFRPVTAVMFTTALCAAAAACGRTEARPAAIRQVQVIDGFDFPESVRYDDDQDVFFVSNIAGYGSMADGLGYISRVRADDLRTIDTFVQSGINGVLLNAPKGMAIQGDTLWVADIDVLRGFDRRTGVPVGNIDLKPFDVVMTNDVAVGPDGAVYVTDSGIVMSRVGVFYEGNEKIFRIGPGRTVSIAARGPQLNYPNGITWDSAGARWLVVGFHPYRSELYAWNPSGDTRTRLASGAGRFDGVEALKDGRILFTSWADSSLHILDGRLDQRVVLNLCQPADIGVDTRRNRVAVPLVLQGRIGIWQLPARQAR